MILNTTHHTCGISLGAMDDAEAAAMGANIRRMRKNARMSQDELASRMRESGQTHWHQNTVSRVEAGKQRIVLGEAHALNAVLGGNVLEGFDQKGLSSLNVSFVTLVDAELSLLTRNVDAIRERLQFLRQAAAELRYLSGEKNWSDGLEVVSMESDETSRRWKYSDGSERTSKRRAHESEVSDGER